MGFYFFVKFIICHKQSIVEVLYGKGGIVLGFSI